MVQKRKIILDAGISEWSEVVLDSKLYFNRLYSNNTSIYSGKTIIIYHVLL